MTDFSNKEIYVLAVITSMARFAHNRKVPSKEILVTIEKRYRTCEVTIDELRIDYGFGRNKMIRVERNE